MSRIIVSVGAAAIAGLVASPSFAEGEKIAFFAASSQNGFNQAIYAGIEESGAAAGVETAIFDGQFNAELQYNQMEDILASGNFDGFIVCPNDPIGIAGAFEQVVAAGVPIATTLFPIGPDLMTLEPQVEGITATVASLPAIGAAVQANGVVEFCADMDPCNVVILIGFKSFPFDNLRLETFLEILGEHDNIKVVAEREGWYDPETSLKAMQDVLQANPDINVVLSNADQHLIGAEIALEAAGIDVLPIFMTGGGAATIAVDAIREGRWDATLAYFPKSMGAIAFDSVLRTLRGETVPNAVDMDKEGPVQALITKEVLDANPDFTGEWAQ